MKKSIAAILSLSLSIAALTGCGSGSSAATETTKAAETVTTAAAEEGSTAAEESSAAAEASDAASGADSEEVDTSNVGVAGTADPEHSTIKYSKSWGPYTVLFEEQIIPLLEAQGYTVEGTDFADLQSADIALLDGEVDVNVEQHTAYAENFNKAQDGDLVTISPIPTVPAGIYSANHASVDEIADGALIAVPDDASNTARAYALLQKAGWIKLDETKDLSTVTQQDIVENPYHLEFMELTSVNIPTTLDEFDYAVITGSIVYNAKIDPSTALLQEDILPHLILQVTVKDENKDAQWARDIVAAYHSDQLKEYMASTGNENGLWYLPY